jgi:hypothetical protein
VLAAQCKALLLKRHAASGVRGRLMGDRSIMESAEAMKPQMTMNQERKSGPAP